MSHANFEMPPGNGDTADEDYTMTVDLEVDGMRRRVVIANPLADTIYHAVAATLLLIFEGQATGNVIDVPA